MPKPDSLQGSLDALMAKILSRQPRLHGYAMLSAIEDISRDVLRFAAGEARWQKVTSSVNLVLRTV